MVPMTLLVPEGLKRDGTNPCVVVGYGGFCVVLYGNRFDAQHQLLMDRGVIWATAHIRGGGELGTRWHEEGRLHQKQNCFDDFAAVLQHLYVRGYTCPERTCIHGGSNGAILMGALLTQHPGMVAGVVSTVGVYDMLRLEQHPNGKMLVGEYGTVTNPDDFRVLHQYSPYHQVKDGVAYPPTLLIAGENDTRVDTMHTRKMAARLQAASTRPEQITMRVYPDQGHLAPSRDKAIEQQAEILDFFLEHTGAERRDEG